MKALVYHLTAARWAASKLAGFISPRAYWEPFAPLRLVDCPVPPLPGPDWVRLRTVLGGICGTDLALIAQRVHPGNILRAFARFPADLGHENVAVIDDVGPAVTGWRAGQRVCVEPAIGCRGRGVDQLCPDCAAGRPALCQHPGDERLPPRAMLGLSGPTSGSWAEYFVAHESQLFAVPDAVGDEAAVLVDPLASAAHAVLRRVPLPGERILVNGCGIIGLGIIAAMRALGYGNDLAVTIRHRFQGELAQRLNGATAARASTPPPLYLIPIRRRAGTAERYEAVARAAGARRVSGSFGNQTLIGGFDLTFDCTGTGAGLSDAMKWTVPRGTVVAVGTSGITLLDTTPLWFDELTILGTNGRQIETVDGKKPHTYELVLNWLATGRLDASAIPVQRYPLVDYRKAFQDLLGRGRHGVVKAAFQP
jgi:threonine dehydrogenase-like Zn-dependent dehydrogenase